jgi:hypothetical protein
MNVFLEKLKEAKKLSFLENNFKEETTNNGGLFSRLIAGRN